MIQNNKQADDFKAAFLAACNRFPHLFGGNHLGGDRYGAFTTMKESGEITGGYWSMEGSCFSFVDEKHGYIQEGMGASYIPFRVGIVPARFYGCGEFWMDIEDAQAFFASPTEEAIVAAQAAYAAAKASEQETEKSKAWKDYLRAKEQYGRTSDAAQSARAKFMSIEEGR